MRDRRSVDDLTIEELEQILRIRKREARLQRLKRFEAAGRRRGDLLVPQEGSPGEQVVVSHAQNSVAQEEMIAHESFYAQEQARQVQRTSRARDRLLLGVEIAAAVGLVTVLVFAFTSLRQINEESAAAQAAEVAGLPTPEPTPLISAVVLPGGHTPPTSPGGAQPNYNEVPAHLRPLVEQQFAGPVIVPTASPSHAIRIRVPAIAVDAPIVQGDGWEQLKKGVAQHIGTANPGAAGNMVLSAHNDIFGEIFRHLDRLQAGDEIIVSTQVREYRYRVLGWQIVPPTDVSVLEQSRESMITLISCYPYLVNSDRIVVTGELVES